MWCRRWNVAFAVTLSLSIALVQPCEAGRRLRNCRCCFPVAAVSCPQPAAACCELASPRAYTQATWGYPPCYVSDCYCPLYAYAHKDASNDWYFAVNCTNNSPATMVAPPNLPPNQACPAANDPCPQFCMTIVRMCKVSQCDNRTYLIHRDLYNGYPEGANGEATLINGATASRHPLIQFQLGGKTIFAQVHWIHTDPASAPVPRPELPDAEFGIGYEVTPPPVPTVADQGTLKSSDGDFIHYVEANHRCYMVILKRKS